MTVVNNIKAAYYNLISARENVEVEEIGRASWREETMHEDEQTRASRRPGAAGRKAGRITSGQRPIRIF